MAIPSYHLASTMLTPLLLPAPLDSIQYARSVREDTAELASYFLSDKKSPRSASFLSRPRSRSSNVRREGSLRSPLSDDEDETIRPNAGASSDTIVEVSEPPSPDEDDDAMQDNDGPSVLANMLRKSPPESFQDRHAPRGTTSPGSEPTVDMSPFEARSRRDRIGNSVIWPPDEDIMSEHATENTPLLRPKSNTSFNQQNGHGDISEGEIDVEGQKRRESRNWLSEGASRVHGFAKTASRPKEWNGKALVHTLVLEPVKTLPAVFVGLILNILDALSYGMILFPLGNPIFANLGPAGISIFYVSTIVSQVVFSTGSIFKGGVGSELIEVVPFFHNMASTITSIVGTENPDAVIATTIFCFSFSSLITGAVFFAMGSLQFGYLVGFIPRHILIGCIGGVGWFLVQTGFEVSSRLEGSFHYDISTLRMLFRPDTVPLWTIPLGLAIVLFVLSTSNKLKDNHYVLPVFICLEPAIFWFFVTVLDSLQPEPLREKGWIFEAPPAGESWWYFYTLFSKSRPERFSVDHGLTETQNSS